ncbi:MAG TPA: ABC transporter permease [Solirubrobacterales bacterium]|nr:ABC transporter permease [Solirubrobacterales bacterium]
MSNETRTEPPKLAPAGGPVEQAPARGLRMNRREATDFALRYAMVGVAIVLAIGAEIAYPGFFAWKSIEQMLSQNAGQGLVAMGMTFVIIAAGFDLSVAAVFALGAVCYVGLGEDMGLGYAFILVILIGVVAGIVNGLIITRLKVNAFVATLGTASIFGGIAYLASNEQTLSSTKAGITHLGLDKWLGMQIPVWILIGAFVIGGVLLAFTVFGRSVYSVGGNREAARLAGIRVDVITLLTYVIVGAMAALAGILSASTTGVAGANEGGEITLAAIAIVIIGGTSLFGGEGAMWRTGVGLAIFAMIDHLFILMNVNTPGQLIAKGAIVIIAVAIDAWSRTRG